MKRTPAIQIISERFLIWLKVLTHFASITVASSKVKHAAIGVCSDLLYPLEEFLSSEISFLLSESLEFKLKPANGSSLRAL